MLSLALCLALGVPAQNGQSHSKAALLSAVRSFAPGQPFEVGLQFKMTPGWHVYWRNPGDSGQEIRVRWSLPAGWKASPLRWPAPKVIEDAGIFNYGYEDSVTLLSTLTPPKKAGRAEISADLSWLVCDDEMCLPVKQSAVLRVKPGLAAIRDPAAAVQIDAVRSKLPRKFELRGARALVSSKRIVFEFVMPPASVPLDFFPYDATLVASGRFQVKKGATGTRVSLVLPKSEFFDRKVTRLRGILVSPSGSGNNRGFVAEIDVPLENSSGEMK
jgi:thiol:disulfide interchange protein DsbD